MGEGGFFLLFVTAQRLVELVLARHNTGRLLARGGREIGARHYPAIVALHASWLVLMFVVARDAEISAAWLTGYVLLQFLRLWILASLGERWTTRIIVVDEPLVRKGPYRFVDHPNYILVAAEFVIVSMVVQQLWIAILYSLLNAAVLHVRIRSESEAWKAITS